MIGRTNSTFGGAISLPDGSTVTPVNDVQTWLKCAGIKDKSYTTVNQVVADTNTMFLLTSDENAMKYLARSTDFADTICADETSMTYLGQSAYVDSTVLNSDLWKQTIKASQYWSLVYASKTVTVHGGAYETITIDGYYGSFTTNADGSCSHVVPIDTITLAGSVSGQSFTRTVTSSTTDVYVMNEHALYWYGNFMTNFVAIANHSSGGNDKNEGYLQAPTINNTTNQIYLTELDSSRGIIGQYITEEKISLNNFSKLYIKVDYAKISTDIGAVYQSIIGYISDSNSSNYVIKNTCEVVSLGGNATPKEITNKTVYMDIPASSGNCYCGFILRSQGILKVSKIWLE